MYTHIHVCLYMHAYIYMYTHISLMAKQMKDIDIIVSRVTFISSTISWVGLQTTAAICCGDTACATEA